MTENLKPGIGFVHNEQNIPEGALPLSPMYLHELQSRIINRWESPREMLALKHGSELLGFVAAINGAIFTNHFRLHMGLRNYARFVSYAPTMFLPALSVSLLHQSMVTYPMAVGHLPCITCAEVKSMFVQSVFGFASPFILSIFATFAMAKLSTCYPLPPFSDYKALLKTIGNLTRPAKSYILALFTFNLIATFLIDYRQRELVEKVNIRLLTENIYVETQANK